MRFLKLMVLGAALVLGLGAPANAQLRVTVEGVNFQPLPIAVPDFGGATPEARELSAKVADVIRNDLQSTGLFQIIPKEVYAPISGGLDISLAPRFPDWSLIQAQALVVGNVVIEGAGSRPTMVAQYRLFDVFQNAQLYSFQYPVAPENWRKAAHMIADDIYSQLTGEKGYFDSRIVFVSESGPETNRRRRLAIMDQDGANPEHLLSGMNSIITPRYSPNSQIIIYSAYVPDEQRPGGTRLRTFLYDTETGRQEVLADIERAAYYAARFSPDGKFVAMSREQNGNSDIFLIELARRNRAPVRLTSSPAIDTSPSFSPDGSMIVFNSDRSGTSHLYIMRADGAAMSCPHGGQETACRISFGEGRYNTPVWSPRGDWIAFTKQLGGRFHIGVITPDGRPGPDGNVERLLTDSYQDEAPTWSPNGRVISFFREAGPGAGPKLWTIDLTGRNLRQLPTPGDASDPAWSPLLQK